MEKWWILFGVFVFLVLPSVAAECGDAICDGNETAENCPVDCDVGNWSVCGDGQCNGSEDSLSCPEDCDIDGDICGDGACGSIENADSCPEDCNFPCLDFCGDGGCQQDDCQGHEGCACWETVDNCPQDCFVQDQNEGGSGNVGSFLSSSFFGSNYFWIGLSVLGAILFIFIGLKILKWLFWILALIMIVLAVVFWFVI